LRSPNRRRWASATCIHILKGAGAGRNPHAFATVLLRPIRFIGDGQHLNGFASEKGGKALPPVQKAAARMLCNALPPVGGKGCGRQLQFKQSRRGGDRPVLEQVR